MKRIVFTVALIAFLCAVVVYAGDPAPSIYIPKMRHDFGKMFEQETYKYAFTVRNRGDADLLIDNVKPG